MYWSREIVTKETKNKVSEKGSNNCWRNEVGRDCKKHTQILLPICIIAPWNGNQKDISIQSLKCWRSILWENYRKGKPDALKGASPVLSGGKIQRLLQRITYHYQIFAKKKLASSTLSTDIPNSCFSKLKSISEAVNKQFRNKWRQNGKSLLNKWNESGTLDRKKDG